MAKKTFTETVINVLLQNSDKWLTAIEIAKMLNVSPPSKVGAVCQRLCITGRVNKQGKPRSKAISYRVKLPKSNVTLDTTSKQIDKNSITVTEIGESIIAILERQKQKLSNLQYDYNQLLYENKEYKKLLQAKDQKILELNQKLSKGEKAFSLQELNHFRNSLPKA